MTVKFSWTIRISWSNLKIRLEMRAVLSMSKTRQNRARNNLPFNSKWRRNWKNRSQFSMKFVPLRNRDFQFFHFLAFLLICWISRYGSVSIVLEKAIFWHYLHILWNCAPLKAIRIEDLDFKNYFKKVTHLDTRI